jgi:amidase
VVGVLVTALVGSAGLAQGQSGSPIPNDRDCLRLLRGIDLQQSTGADLQAALAARKLTSVDLVDAYLARIAAFDASGSKLNAIREINPTARAQAAQLDAERRAGRVRGPLHGLPVLLKDNVGTIDQPTTAGSIALEGSIPLRDAFVTQRLRDAGAVILGKTNLSEFANWVSLNMPNGYSSLGGQVLGAYDLGDPLGSSSGSGVAGAMAFSAFTIGTETSGSIISPSVVGSLVGVKPTVGLVSRAGIIPLSPSFDTAGPMTRNVTDAAAVLSAISGPDPRDDATHGVSGKDYLAGLKPDALRGVRLAFAEDDSPSGAAGAAYAAALDKLRALGATLVPVRSLGATGNVGLTEIAAIPNEFKASLNQYLATEVRPGLRVRTLSEIIAFNAQHPDKVKYGQDLLQVSDATPGNATLGVIQSGVTRVASRAGIDVALAEAGATGLVTYGTTRVNLAAAAGYPTVTVPIGYDPDTLDRLALTFHGTGFSEDKLLAYAYAYEQATKVRRPPTEPRFEGRPRPGSCAAAARPPFTVKKAVKKKAKKKATRCRRASGRGRRGGKRPSRRCRPAKRKSRH